MLLLLLLSIHVYIYIDGTCRCWPSRSVLISNMRSSGHGLPHKAPRAGRQSKADIMAGLRGPCLCRWVGSGSALNKLSATLGLASPVPQLFIRSAWVMTKHSGTQFVVSSCDCTAFKLQHDQCALSDKWQKAAWLTLANAFATGMLNCCFAGTCRREIVRNAVLISHKVTDVTASARVGVRCRRTSRCCRSCTRIDSASDLRHTNRQTC